MRLIINIISGLVIFVLFSCQNDKQNERIEVTSEKEVKSGNTRQIESLPEIIVKGGETVTLGKIKEGIKTRVVFTLKNIGKAKATGISVHDLSKGGCTAVSKVTEISCGDSVNLEFIFETLGYGGTKQKRQIRVRYNNPELSPVTLSVVAEVLPAEPYEVPIGELFYNFFVLVDIRNRQEFLKGHIIGAINVPAEELESWASQLPKSFLIYLYSDIGGKSDQYAKVLRGNGYSHALSIIGGLAEWREQYGDRHIISGDK